MVAVVGGGQLARMMQESAIALGVHLRVLVECADGATGQVVVDAPVGAASDVAAVTDLVEGTDVLTFEHEHVPADVLERVSARVPVRPAPAALHFAQDKLAMRERLSGLGVPCPRWARIDSEDDLDAFASLVGYPFVLKVPVGGYDGHGVHVVHDSEEARGMLGRGPLLAEEKVPFVMEIAALVARRPSGEVRAWPVVATEQADGVCALVSCPAPGLSEAAATEASGIAERIAVELDVTGVLAVEMFVMADPERPGGQRVSVNELAMRPHNSGHWTIDGAVTSQFEQHLRAVLDLPLGSTAPTAPATVMANLLGSSLPDPALGLSAALAVDPRVRVHLYGKEVRPGRKLGHVSVAADSLDEARSFALTAVAALRGTTMEEKP